MFYKSLSLLLTATSISFLLPETASSDFSPPLRQLGGLTNTDARSPTLLHRRLEEDANGNPSFFDTAVAKLDDFFFSDKCARPDEDTSRIRDLSNWMALIDANTSLADLTLPGTHNSAAYDLSTHFNENDPQYNYIQEATFGIDLPNKLIAKFACRFALTQSLSISEQLRSGIRYFDLRVDYDEETSTFRAFHLLFGLPIQEILKEIRDFIRTNPSEILVIEMRELLSPSVTAEKKQELAQTILEAFGSNLFPVTSVLPTIGEMQAAGTTVIVAVQDGEINASSEMIWPTSGKIRDTFANTVDVEKMDEYNQERLVEFNAESDQFLFNKLSWILTPDTDYLKDSLLHGSIYSLAKDEANPALIEFASKNENKQLGNILIVDYVEQSPLFDVLGLSSTSDEPFVPDSPANRLRVALPFRVAVTLGVVSTSLALF
jgi:1-phosphatidylinositol phosphodiesterase